MTHKEISPFERAIWHMDGFCLDSEGNLKNEPKKGDPIGPRVQILFKNRFYTEMKYLSPIFLYLNWLNY